MNQANCPAKGKKCAIFSAIVAVAAGLIAWSLIALYSSAPAIEETIAEEEIEEELPEETPPAQEPKSEKKSEAPAKLEKPPETKTEKAE